MRWLLLFVLIASYLLPQSYDSDDRRTAMWQSIKQELSGPHGSEYFEQSVKGALFPRLDGTLVSSTPADHPTEFLVAMPGSDLPDVTLKLKGSLEKPLPPGTPVMFEGVAREFNARPFMLTFEVETVNRATVPAKKPEPKPPGRNSK